MRIIHTRAIYPRAFLILTALVEKVYRRHPSSVYCNDTARENNKYN